ncbi:fatty-acyl-CoA synthase [Sphingomonas sp. PP-F2F-A104-K0414]|uniref:long-chain-fatty-acid--CoA ligase n=1 Tax=Sphingomonas sp. PP-F2F-A104-K0414 TaxID=2135661 RepID=UPI0010F0744C|nr:long-chain-fatty-acid--CoA ligase [Sphingomonas sp. PP-F2F-A104-K0414]TCP95867.1 fatty-acyl-CoA synthase [Sphingomonas sp. PP-F2F-A104-K0414]
MPLQFAVPAPDRVDVPLTIRHLLDANIRSAADQTIGYRDTVRYDNVAFRGRVGRLASVLGGLGVEHGTTVAILDWDSHRYLEHYFAVPMMGAVLQTVNIRLSPQQIAYTLAHAGAEVLVVHVDFLPLIADLRADLPAVRAIIVIEEDAADVPTWAIGCYETMLDEGSPAFPFEDFDENAIATKFYTSGTTGLPKQVCFSHRQLVLHTLALGTALAERKGLSLRAGDVYMPLTPMFHVHSWGIPYLATMLGLKQIYPGRYDMDFILRLRSDEGVTFSHGVPTVLQMVLASAERQKLRLDGWQMIIGGSALPRELADAARAEGMTIAVGYGMSETGPVISIGEESEDRYTAIRSGKPIPLVSTEIVDEDMRPLISDDATQGELVLRAPWLTPCYPGDDDASAALWRGGWLHTQDIATIDAEGSIQIRDRIKDVIKTGGEWISSLMLEDLILKHPDVAEVSVVGMPDPKWQERPVAAIVAQPGSQPTCDAINDMLRASMLEGLISRYALLDDVKIVDALPRTSVGKIDKKSLRVILSA